MFWFQWDLYSNQFLEFENVPSHGFHVSCLMYQARFEEYFPSFGLNQTCVFSSFFSLKNIPSRGFRVSCIMYLARPEEYFHRFGFHVFQFLETCFQTFPVMVSTLFVRYTWSGQKNSF